MSEVKLNILFIVTLVAIFIIYAVVLQLQTKCQCDVLQFPFSSLPEVFGQLKTFQWKPVIIKVSNTVVSTDIVSAPSTKVWGNTLQSC